MAKIRCIRCDICGEEIDATFDFQFRFFLPQKPRVFMGVPYIGMEKLDLCEECGILIQTQVKVIRGKAEDE